MITIPMKVATNGVTVPVKVSASEIAIHATLGVAYVMAQKPEYSGEYVFTPTQETQTVETADKVLVRNITINPIPQNYGLITWNGSVLTVS